MHKSPPASPSSRANYRQWTGLAVLALPTLLLSLDVSVLFLAAPHLAADLESSSTELLWIMDVYGFMIAGFLVAMGSLGDRIGRRRLLMIGAAAFTLASVAAAFAPSAPWLIVARAAMGVAGATLMPSTLSMIRNMFLEPAQRRFAIGVWMMCFSVGVALGPLVGGAMLERFWWGSVFLLGVPVMLVLLVVGPRLLPESRDGSPAPFDIVSAAISVVSIVLVVYAVKDAVHDPSGWTAVTMLVVGLACGWLFVRRQRTRADPLVDVTLFARPAVSIALVLLLLGMVAVNGIEYLAAQYLQLIEGLSPLRAGLWTLPAAVAVIVGSLVSPWLANRIVPIRLIALGAVLSVGGFALLTQAGPSQGLSVLISGMVVVTLGLSPTMVLGTDMVVAAAPARKSGAAAALAETSAELGVALGIATMGVLSSVTYRTSLTAEDLGHLPTEATETAKESLATAYTVADALPPEASGELVAVARHAFADGFQVSAAVGVALASTVALLAVAAFRKTAVGDHSASENSDPQRSDGV